MITGTCAQDKENADYVEWLKGQTELEEPEGVKDMVRKGNCFINMFFNFPNKMHKVAMQIQLLQI